MVANFDRVKSFPSSQNLQRFDAINNIFFILIWLFFGISEVL